MDPRRNKHHLKLLLLALTPGSISFGKIDQSSPPKVISQQQNTKSGKRVVEVGESVIRDSSEYYRDDKNGFLAFELFGSSPFPFGSHGFMGGIYFNPDTIVDGSYTTGKNDLYGFNMKSESFAIRYKKFNGNSFYWRAGGMYRTYEYNTEPEALSDNPVSGTVKVSSLGVDFAIGNQWQWKTLTQGIDWIGFFSPLTGTYTVSRPANATDEWHENEKKPAASLSKQGGLQLFRYYLGISI